jgi:DNA-binding response OmpR family regulator
MAKKILVVDDDDTTVKLLEFMLEKNGYDVETRSNGKDALDSVLSVSPDLILMDVMMPIMDGLEAIQKIRQIDEFRSTPIYILSSLGQEVEVTRGLSSGATGYIVKPFDSKALLRIISENLGED